MTTAVRTLHLGGSLAEKYAPSIEIAFDKWHQVLGALVSRFGPAIKEDLRIANWHVFDGEVKPGNDVQEGNIHHRTFQQKDVYIIPAVEGEGRYAGIILGVILIIVGFFAYGTTTSEGVALIAAGAVDVLAGVAGLLTKPPSGTAATGNSGVDENASHIYSAAVNVVGQGTAIPLIYGRHGRASSIIIASNFSSDQVLSPVAGSIGGNTGNPDPGGTPVEPSNPTQPVVQDTDVFNSWYAHEAN